VTCVMIPTFSCESISTTADLVNPLSAHHRLPVPHCTCMQVIGAVRRVLQQEGGVMEPLGHASTRSSRTLQPSAGMSCVGGADVQAKGGKAGAWARKGREVEVDRAMPLVMVGGSEGVGVMCVRGTEAVVMPWSLVSWNARPGICE